MIGSIYSVINGATRAACRFYDEHPRIVHLVAGGILGAYMPFTAPIARIACVVLGGFVGANTTRVVDEEPLVIGRMPELAPIMTEEVAAARLTDLVLSRNTVPSDAELLEPCRILNINPVAVRGLWDRSLWEADLSANDRFGQLEEIFQSQGR
jgi:hypothetical protein